jgi:hypothetical protein
MNCNRNCLELYRSCIEVVYDCCLCWKQGCPLPQLLEEDTASLMELGIGSGASIVVDEES